ncbi:hypothetical protein V6Z11_D09G072700 [Gossypium hirsutum]
MIGRLNRPLRNCGGSNKNCATKNTRIYNEIPHQFSILFSFFCPHPLPTFPNFSLPDFYFFFCPSGKLVQIEHALTAVGSGQTSLGIKAANGVVIATEKKLPSILVDETSVQKIQCLTPNIGVVYSGMGPDFRVLVRKSRKQAEQYHRLYKLKVEYEKGTSEKNGNVVYHYFFTCLMIHGLAAMF